MAVLAARQSARLAPVQGRCRKPGFNTGKGHKGMSYRTFVRIFIITQGGRGVNFCAESSRDRKPAFVRIRERDRKSTRLNSSHLVISYAVFCLKKKKKTHAAS